MSSAAESWEMSNDRPAPDFLRSAEDVLKSLRSYRTRRKAGRHSVDDAGIDIQLSGKYIGKRIVTPKLNAAGRRMLGSDEETA